MNTSIKDNSKGIKENSKGLENWNKKQKDQIKELHQGLPSEIKEIVRETLIKMQEMSAQNVNKNETLKR